jgi:glucose-6-phosphate isomerase
MNFSFRSTSGLTAAKIRSTGMRLSSYVDRLRTVADSGEYLANESSINLPFDKDLLDAVQRVCKDKVTNRLKYVIVVGIGGSNLGTKAVYDARCGFFDVLEPGCFPKVLFVDTTHAAFLEKLEQLLHDEVRHPEEIIVNAISKSGGTTETAANTEVILKMLETRWKSAKNRLVVTTDIGSKLWNSTDEQGIALLPIPTPVGGRYSVFSPVGLFPLAAAGFDMKSLLRGAQRMRDACLDKNTTKNPALASAAILFLQNRAGKTINDNFFFNPELESLGKWYRQLMGESIGKETDLKGKNIHAGITPTVSIGSTDLHSVGQLYLGGPLDKLTTFVRADSTSRIRTPGRLTFPLVAGIAGKRITDIMYAIYGGVTAAYRKKKLPYTEICLADTSEQSLGEYLQFKMMEIMYLGKLMNVNAFDQPNVELYKKETKRLLHG